MYRLSLIFISNGRPLPCCQFAQLTITVDGRAAPEIPRTAVWHGPGQGLGESYTDRDFTASRPTAGCGRRRGRAQVMCVGSPDTRWRCRDLQQPPAGRRLPKGRHFLAAPPIIGHTSDPNTKGKTMKRKRLALATATAAAALGLGIAQSAMATTTGNPQLQSGIVHSYTTGGNADVTSDDGGLNWCFNGNCNGSDQNEPLDQTGTVHSYTTGGNAGVHTENGGYDWQYDG
jgi:hypothetical protein